MIHRGINKTLNPPRASLAWHGPGWYAGKTVGCLYYIHCVHQDREAQTYAASLARKAGYSTPYWADSVKEALAPYQ